MRNAPGLRWRVLRSETDYAVTADALPGGDQTVVMEGTQTHLRDERIVEGEPYYYTVFALDPRGVWHTQVKTKLAHGDRLRWLHHSLDRWPHETDSDQDEHEQVTVVATPNSATWSLTLEAQQRNPALP